MLAHTLSAVPYLHLSSDGPWLSLNVTGKHVAYVCMWPTPPNHTYWWVAIEVVVV